jgi:hypothetical protein
MEMGPVGPVCDVRAVVARICVKPLRLAVLTKSTHPPATTVDWDGGLGVSAAVAGITDGEVLQLGAELFESAVGQPVVEQELRSTAVGAF